MILDKVQMYLFTTKYTQTLLIIENITMLILK